MSDADRAKAAELCLEMPLGIDLNDIYNTEPFREQVDRIAAALAEARAPYDRLTADLRAVADGLELDFRHTTADEGALLAAARLRAVIDAAEEAKA